jgi:hypothetical protein
VVPRRHRTRVSDLPTDERAELLEDLAAHFIEFEADEDLAATLGDPVAYARELRPAWWVLRAWLIVAALAGGFEFPFPRIANNPLIGIAALLLIVPVSIKLGRQAREGQRKGLNVALTAFDALFFVVLPASANDNPIYRDYKVVPSTTRTVTGLWAFDAAGEAYLTKFVSSNAANGHQELQALCPSEITLGPARTLRTAEGIPVVCVGTLPATLPPQANGTVPSTARGPASTVASATTIAPTTTNAPPTTPAATTTGG